MLTVQLIHSLVGPTIIRALRYLHAVMTSPEGRKQRLYYCLFHTSNHLNPFPQILFPRLFHFEQP